MRSSMQRTMKSPRSRTSMSCSAIVGRARRQHLTAAREAQRPVDESIARIAGTDDDAGAEVGRAAGQLLLGLALGEVLVAAVVFDAVELLRVHRLRREHGRRFVDRLLAELVDRDRREEQILPDVILQQLGGRVDRLRHHDPGVDDRVPVAAAQPIEIGAAIAEDRLDVGEERRVGLAAVEERERVTARARCVHDRGADEAGAAEDEDALGLRGERRRCRRRRGRHGRRFRSRERAAGRSAGERREKIAAAKSHAA